MGARGPDIVTAVEGITRRPLAMNDGIGLAEKMLGMPGLVVLEVEDVPGEVVVRAESTRIKATCPSCRRRAQAHDRVEVHLRDLHCFGRPTRLVCQRPRQNPHRRPIELPTDGQRNSPGTATGIPQERTAMSAPSTT
jgi:hypothetical protein